MKAKYLFILALISLFSLVVKAQGNLQFNQVFTYNGFMGQCEDGTTWTVPSGKVWKLEHFTSTWLIINGGRAANSDHNNGAIWLKPGDTVKYSAAAYGSCCCGAQTNYVISIIEFNVVP